MSKLLFSIVVFLCLISCLQAQSYLPLTGGTLSGNLSFSNSASQIQSPYYGFNAPYTQPSTSNNVSIFANGTANYLDIVGFVNGWRLIPGNASTYHIPVVTFTTTGAATLGDNVSGLPPGGSALTLRGSNSPAGGAGFQDINYSFISAGSARIRAYRGGSWDTYLQFLVNKVSQGSDAPYVAMHIDQSGYVGIGTTAPQSLLAVKGTITAQKVVVVQTGWSDYVFDSSYQLLSLDTVENFIQANKHLPDVPSAKEIQTDGNDLADNQRIMLQKIEELTLYIISQNKQLTEQNKKIEALQNEVKIIKKHQQ